MNAGDLAKNRLPFILRYLAMGKTCLLNVNIAEDS